MARLTKGRGTRRGEDAHVNQSDSYEMRRQIELLDRHAVPANGILFLDNTKIDTQNFDASGKGRGIYAGWIKCNGHNGTTNLTALLAGVTPIMRI